MDKQKTLRLCGENNYPLLTLNSSTPMTGVMGVDDYMHGLLSNLMI
jgi:hypothetical protein